MEVIVTQSVEKVALIPLTHVYTNQLLRMMELRMYGANAFPTSFMW